VGGEPLSAVKTVAEISTLGENVCMLCCATGAPRTQLRYWSGDNVSFLKLALAPVTCEIVPPARCAKLSKSCSPFGESRGYR
jgi:hypothetical protein